MEQTLPQMDNPSEEQIEKGTKRKLDDMEKPSVEVIEATPVKPTLPPPSILKKNVAIEKKNKTVRFKEEENWDTDTEEDIEEDEIPQPIKPTKTIKKPSPKSAPTTTQLSTFKNQVIEKFRAQMPEDVTSAASTIAVKGFWSVLFIGFLVAKSMLQNNYVAKIQQQYPPGVPMSYHSPIQSSNSVPNPNLHTNHQDFSAFK